MHPAQNFNGDRIREAKRWIIILRFIGDGHALRSPLVRRSLDRFSREFSRVIADDPDALPALIEGGEPGMVCRLGSVELAAVRRMLLVDRLGLKKQSRFLIGGTNVASMAANAGAYPPTTEMTARIAERLIVDLSEADIVARWKLFMERQIVSSVCPSATQIPLTRLDPFLQDPPWTQSLQGKSVLVIHPFADSISAQFDRRDHLFKEPNYLLPEMDLTVVRAEQSIGGTHPTHTDWFESLAVMEEQIEKSSASVVLIAAGAYGLPLAAVAKRCGKLGIHVGGVLQLFFGIRGRRWDNNEAYERRATQAWVRPLPHETPPHGAEVEGWCYW